MKLLSFGEIVWDIYKDEKTLGGAPLNLAAHASLQGCDSWLLSSVGKDTLGEESLSLISNLGIHTDLITSNEIRPTGRCIVSLDQNGLPTYHLSEEMACDEIRIPEQASLSYDVLAFGSLALRSDHNRKTINQLLGQKRFSEVYTDLNIRPPFYSKETVAFCLSHATIAKVSDEELPLITNLIYGTEWDIPTAAQRISVDHPQIRLLLITQGAEGATCYDCQRKHLESCPAEQAEVVSTVGAGDSFGATFLTQYLQSGDIAGALSLAAKISAFVVSKKEAIPPDTLEFLKTISFK